jgi:hypothetical protein
MRPGAAATTGAGGVGMATGFGEVGFGGAGGRCGAGSTGHGAAITFGGGAGVGAAAERVGAGMAGGEPGAGLSVETRSPGPVSGDRSTIGACVTGGRVFGPGRTISSGGAGTGSAAIASVSRGFTVGGGIVGPSGVERDAGPLSRSAGTAGDRSRGGSGGDQVITGGVGAGSTAGDVKGGTGTGTAGAAGVFVAGSGGFGVAIGARTSGDFTSAGAATRGGGGGEGLGLGGAAGADRAGADAAGLLGRTDIAVGAGTVAGRAGPLHADSLMEIEPPEPGTGNTSSALMPGRRLASHTTKPRTMTWRDSEPDMQTPSLTAEGLCSGGAGEAS